MNKKNIYKKPILVIAPGFELPPRNGTSMITYFKWGGFSNYLPFVDVLGKHALYRFEANKVKILKEYKNNERSKISAGLLGVLKFAHYLQSKLITKEYTKEVLKLLNNDSYGTFVFNFIWTYDLFRKYLKKNKLTIIETHNNEVLWYWNFISNSGNLFVIISSLISIINVKLILKRINKNVILIHVSEEDMNFYKKELKENIHFYVPVGFKNKNLTNYKINHVGKKYLLFFGSLSVKMNYDSLNYFLFKFYPLIKNEFGDTLQIVVAGTKPDKKIKLLCARNGWQLYPDLPEQFLGELITNAIATLLPYRYKTGAKLKLLESLSYGTPVIGTFNMKSQLPVDLPFCLFSDNVNDWISHIKTLINNKLTLNDKYLLQNTVKDFQWETITYNSYKELVA